MAYIRCGYFLRCTVFISFLGGFTANSQNKALSSNQHLQDGAEPSNGQGTSVREAFQVDNDADTVTWTEWTEWSTCTKTCGFGISIRTRECVNEAGLKSRKLSDVGGERTSGCLGAYKEIQTCNTQISLTSTITWLLCPTGIATPRESQCEEFNNKAFMGRQYQWEAFINPLGRCELTCRAKGFRFYARLAATVADGTPCTPGSTDVCIAGECQKVGCDGIVGSIATMDVCGKCRGDNSTCIVKSGVFSTENLIQGYNTVLGIPVGAANINISEVRSSSNFLAIRTSDNKYILNGPRDLSSVGEYFGAGTKFTYNKNIETWCPGQCFFALGPIEQALEVQILFYHRNPGLRYRYSVPIAGIVSKPQEGIIPTANEGQQFEADDANLRGYVSDSREIQNDARRDREQHRARHSKKHLKNDKSSLPLPNYSQSFTYGRSSVLNDRYRQMTSNERSSDDRVGHSSRSNGGYPDTRNRSPHSKHEQNSHTRYTNRAVPGIDDRHAQQSRHAERLAHETRLREHQRAREQAARNRERDLRHRQTETRNRQTDTRNRQTDTRHRQTDPRYRHPDSRYQETDRNLPTRNYHNRGQVDNQQRAKVNRHTSHNGRHVGSTGSNAAHGSLVQGARQTQESVYDSRTRQVGLHATRRQDHDLSIQKQPVFVNRQDGSKTSNRALTDSANQNRIPVSGPVHNNRYTPRLDTRGRNRDVWRQNQVTDLEYAWKTSGLTECSESCGGGYQQSIVVCVKRSSQVTVTGENCEHMIRPESHTVICNQKPCPAGWVPSDWGQCTVSCGGGVQSREVTCKRRISPELTLAVSASDCVGKVKPPTRQRCAEENCFQWTVGNWTKCSASCGKGERTREVVCQSVDSSVVGENDCLRGSRKPLDREVCDMGSCGTGWFYTPWPTQCTVSCGEGEQNRKIHCAGPRGEPFPDERCKQFHKPEVTRTCKTEIPCGGKWFTGPWSNCNATCGEGKQTRDVVCMKKLNTDFFTVVDEENCVSKDRPDLNRPCPNIPICLPEWYMKDWAECSASCGTGYRTREVKCLDVEGSASPECFIQDKPVIRESCNTQSCHKRRHRPTDDGCKDTYSSCHLVVQARLCRFKYYQKVCCDSCVQSGQLNR